MSCLESHVISLTIHWTIQKQWHPSHIYDHISICYETDLHRCCLEVESDKDIQYYFDNLQLNCPSTFAESVDNKKVAAQQTRPAQHTVIKYISRDIKYILGKIFLSFILQWNSNLKWKIQ